MVRLITKHLYIKNYMSVLDEVLAHYEQKEKESLSPEQHDVISSEATEHLANYLVGDGNVQHLYDYYECLEKIN